jgi:hypothetical protein
MYPGAGIGGCSYVGNGGGAVSTVTGGAQAASCARAGAADNDTATTNAAEQDARKRFDKEFNAMSSPFLTPIGAWPVSARKRKRLDAGPRQNRQIAVTNLPSMTPPLDRAKAIKPNRFETTFE